ncbi:hypothetical protein [Paenibacillus sp. PK1-4R]|uniref:hypothetical protein n=1 Tax=Paenibacillus sp. PK1-4R TaxID=3049075 RepID=UPI0025A24B15|nr:hypothetical protein [Paenibacillus sp. PK1-4R]WJM08326.1 hypothetical protein QNO02_29755 [Paenibacillus sp. PK1-4R]
MDLALYLFYKKDTKQLAELLLSSLKDFSQETHMKSSEDYYTITNPNFSFIVQDDDELVSFTREELNLNINYCINISVFSHSPEEGLQVIFQAINTLSDRLDEDIALTDSESGVIFLRSDGQLVINSHCRENPDIYDWPYDLLDGNFIEKDMAGLI